MSRPRRSRLARRAIRVVTDAPVQLTLALPGSGLALVWRAPAEPERPEPVVVERRRAA